MNEQIYDRIENLVKEKVGGSSHGWNHIERVYNLSLKLAENKKIDLDILKAAVLLHDIERDKEVNKRLKSEGWKVIRFWESEIKKDIDRCARKIKKMMKMDSILRSFE